MFRYSIVPPDGRTRSHEPLHDLPVWLVKTNEVTRIALALAAALIVCGTAPAAEQVVLTNGFRIRADRHESASGKVKLYTSTGVIELEATQVAEIEQEEYVAPPPAPAVAPVTPVTTAANAAVTPIGPVKPEVLLKDAADKYGLPPEFLHSVARVESGLQANAVSPKGAIGLMQLMPGTAAQLKADPNDPAQNVDAGARHLRDLLVQYGGSTHKALSAYNAGAGAVQKYNGVPPYAETRTYVEKVLRNYQKMTQSAGPAAGEAEKATGVAQ